MSEEMFSKEDVQRMIREGIADALKDERARAAAEQEEFMRQRVEKQRDYAQLMKNSSIPWVNVESGETVTEEGLPVEIDWNEAMIKYLKANGVPGLTEEEIVQTWLNGIYHEMATNDNPDKDKGDYA